LKLISQIVPFLLFWTVNLSLSFGSSGKPEKLVEMTRFDITEYKDIQAKDISIFGIYLTMKTEELLNTLEASPFIYLEKDIFLENRFYLYDRQKKDDKNILLAYLVLGESDTGIKEITLYNGIIRYLTGNSKLLLTYDILNKNSYIVTFFTGYPSYRELIIDIPKIGLKTYAYYYREKNFIVSKNISKDNVSLTFSLVLNLNQIK
jgi:hypothetical protein